MPPFLTSGPLLSQAIPAGGDGSALAQSVIRHAAASHAGGQRARANRLYRLALAVDPAAFDAVHLFGVVQRSDAPVEALAWIDRALRLHPGHAAARHNLIAVVQAALPHANRCYEQRRYRDLCRIADALAAIDPSRRQEASATVGRMLHNAAGTLLDEDGDVDFALACAERSCLLLRHPSNLNLRMLLRLNRQDYATAWNSTDWREIAGLTRQWDGKPHPGPLVIVSRNGTGDLVQFLRFVPRVLPLAREVVMVLRNEQIRLVRHSPLLEGVVLTPTDPQLPGSAYCDAFSLGFALGLREADIPVATPYIVPPADLAADWRRAIRRDGRLHVGIAWSSWASPDHRSVPFEFFDRLMERTDAAFVGLHSSFSRNELCTAAFPEHFRFFGVSDLPTTACILSAMDLVIAPDGGIVHMACALGVESWVLTIRNCDWRWRGEGADSLWYPNARLFRQPAAGDWETVWRQVAGRLENRIRNLRRPVRIGKNLEGAKVVVY